ncbi:MAG: LytTR family DNA-binding domain-containing protein [Desulfomicrobium sp.]|nr:LytTR family DNA-binding domain-containing protein [Desulfomicrobium sp.]NLV96517.1 response regulator transcription factor [Desulfovibrionales bacterium]
MSKLKALLLHPDPKVRTQLRDMLAPVKEIAVLGEAVSSFEALEMLSFIPYDIFFMGTELPHGVSGMELAEHLSHGDDPPALIFLATEEDHAFAAFELGAADYLLWPAPPHRFARTIERLRPLLPRKKISSPVQPLRGHDILKEETVLLSLGDEEEESFINALRQAWDINRERPVEIEKLPINQDGRHILIPYTQIVYIEAYEDYSFVHTAQDRFLSSHRLKNLEIRLRPHRFCRVHRKYLVNLDMVTEIATMPGGNFMLRTAGRKKIELPVSRRRIGELKKILQL